MKFRVVCTKHGNMPVIPADNEVKVVEQPWSVADSEGIFMVHEDNLYCTGLASNDGWEHEFKIEVVE